MAVEVNAAYDGDPPSMLELRKALTGMGTILSITPVRPGLVRIAFEDGTDPNFGAPLKVGGKPVTLTETTVIHSRGTIHRRELALWTLEELQEQLPPGIRVLRRLSTRAQAAENSGRILLGFPNATLPEEVLVPIMGAKLKVQPYIPGTTRCRLCHSYTHQELKCNRAPRCGRCGSQDHERAKCNVAACCPSCKGPHEITDPLCPTWQAEKRRIRQAVTGVAAAPEPQAKPFAPTVMDFPSLQGKRKTTTPPTPPAPKRWAQPPLTDAPVGSSPDLLRILENQTALLMQIMQLLQRLLTTPVEATHPLPASAPSSSVELLPAEPATPLANTTTTTTSSGPPATITPIRSPKTRRQKEKQLLLNTDPTPTTGTSRVLNLGRDTASPSANNIGTFDFKEK